MRAKCHSERSGARIFLGRSSRESQGHQELSRVNKGGRAATKSKNLSLGFGCSRSFVFAVIPRSIATRNLLSLFCLSCSRRVPHLLAMAYNPQDSHVGQERCVMFILI
jgi:hypothetical protein